MIAPDPTAYLEAEATFPPNHPRHYVVTRQEADELGNLLGVEFDEHFRLDLHIAMSRTAHALFGATFAGQNPWPELTRAFEQGNGIVAATTMRDDPDPYRAGAAFVLLNQLSLQTPAVAAGDLGSLYTAMRDANRNGVELARLMKPRRGRPKATQVQPLHLLVKVAADIARDAGAKLSLPSNERSEIGTPLTDFASALVEKAIERVGSVAQHALSTAKAKDVKCFANSSRPTARVIVHHLREALKDR